MTFASTSLTEHLVRGFFGFTALVGAVFVMMQGSAWSIPIALVGVVLLRGCPTCWMIGLMETVGARSTARLCSDGTCGLYGSYFSKWKERLTIKLWSGWPTFPQVFVQGVLLGGEDLTVAALADGRVREMLAKGPHQ